MGLLSRLFGSKDSGGSAPSGLEESVSTEPKGSKGAPRRELVQVMLRDTMRKHGIPSDWIDCRILSVVTRRRAQGLHVQLIVRQGHAELLSYVYAFQESFTSEVEKFDARAGEWLLSVAWQFEGSGPGAQMPDPTTWSGSAPAGAAPASAAAMDAQPHGHEDEVTEDLKALFRIRDEALKEAGGDRPDFEPTRPGFVDSGQR